MNNFYLLLFFLYLPVIGFSQDEYCTKDTAFHIVVLGSSTAEGAGANPIDSSWVNRYRFYLQNLNPNYQVTNLARGGFTSYRLMPDGFVPPTGRPERDTARNITKALSLQPDALIINLPSNDVSSGFSVEEQLSNFDTLVGLANLAGVPIWVSTTQPKNYNGNQVFIQRQLDVRDSLLSRFAPFVINFWEGLADTTNQIADTYDSGDGTHLNNSGHGELFERVKQTDIPGYLIVPSSFVDLRFGKPFFENLETCGLEIQEIFVPFYNRGVAENDFIPIDLLLTNEDSLKSIAYQDTLYNGLGTCEGMNLKFDVDLSQGGNYRVFAWVNNGGIPPMVDPDLVLEFNVLGTPKLVAQPDTNCAGDDHLLSTIHQPDDWINWFGSATGNDALGEMENLLLTGLTETSSYYAMASRGSRVYSETLNTGLNTDVDWNGMMIDLIADTTLILDSIAFKISDPGNHGLEVFRKTGSHQGFELDASAWELFMTYSFSSTTDQELVSFPLDNLVLNDGDTIALHFRLANSAARLTYKRVVDPVTHQNNELILNRTSGVSYNFSEVYFPRDFRGELFYHYGEKPFGDCQSDRIEVSAFVSEPMVALGRDTALNMNNQITLDAGVGYSTYLWSDGSTNQTITLDGNILGVSVNEISVEVSDAFGCVANDTIIIEFNLMVNQKEVNQFPVSIWPNPSNNDFWITIYPGEWELEVFNTLGQRKAIYNWQCSDNCIYQIATKDWEFAYYFLVLKSKSGVTEYRKILKSE